MIDGDTLQVDGEVIPLYGIDAPELGQLCESKNRLSPCGMNAALALDKIVSLNKSSLRCSPWKDGQSAPRSPPATVVEICGVVDEDLAMLMLHSGNGLALPGAFPDYLDAERQARDARLGIWQTDFVAHGMALGRSFVDSARNSTRDCNIKGVIGADGQRLYYVPTDPPYGAIAVDRSGAKEASAATRKLVRPGGGAAARPPAQTGRRPAPQCRGWMVKDSAGAAMS